MFKVHISRPLFRVTRPFNYNFQVRWTLDGLFHSFQALDIKSLNINKCKIDDGLFIKNIVDCINIDLVFLVSRSSELFKWFFSLDNRTTCIP